MSQKQRTESEVKDSPDSAPIVEVTESQRPDASLGLVLTQVIIFLMDGQRYALPIESVQEIQQIVEFTPVPGTTPALAGMIDLRGTVVPLIALRLILGLPSAPFQLETPLVFARVKERLVAYIVDEVVDVIDMSGTSLQPPSELYALSERLLGVSRLADGLLFVLDPECLVPDSALDSVDALVDGGVL
ncbi:MAG: purine-binding chemotaxis protein CheW [Coriobacteriia bacterium]|nr:purine-binding chemotaxis protein CheW [Coriobacteriia bacterium]MBN2823664.1 purine-binding chemotaxis protein CheW [Coriobacteriia bacterium]